MCLTIVKHFLAACHDDTRPLVSDRHEGTFGVLINPYAPPKPCRVGRGCLGIGSNAGVPTRTGHVACASHDCCQVTLQPLRCARNQARLALPLPVPDSMLPFKHTAAECATHVDYHVYVEDYSRATVAVLREKWAPLRYVDRRYLEGWHAPDDKSDGLGRPMEAADAETDLFARQRRLLLSIGARLWELNRKLDRAGREMRAADKSISSGGGGKGEVGAESQCSPRERALLRDAWAAVQTQGAATEALYTQCHGICMFLQESGQGRLQMAEIEENFRPEKFFRKLGESRRRPSAK